jgi:hypothetical protein
VLQTFGLSLIYWAVTQTRKNERNEQWLK